MSYTCVKTPQSYFLSTSSNNRLVLFWPIEKLCGIQRETISSNDIEWMMIVLMLKVVVLLRQITLWPWNINSRTSSMDFGRTTDFGRPAWNYSYSELSRRLNSSYHQWALIFDGASAAQFELTYVKTFWVRTGSKMVLFTMKLSVARLENRGCQLSWYGRHPLV